MKTIIIATDFSIGSENAIKYGRKLAKTYGFNVVYLHAYSPPILDPNVPIGLIEETYADTISQFENKLKELIEEDGQNGIQSNYKISFSDLTSLIEETDHSEHIELILIGKTGNTGFIEKLLGSTASHLVNHVHKPLLVIPENFNGDIFDQIIYASALEYDEEEYLKKAIEWKNNSKNKLIIAHIIEKYGLDIFPNSQFIDSINANFKKEGIEIIERKNIDFEKGINEVIETYKGSLLILTTHKRGFFDGIINPSKTKAILGETEIPVLVFSFNK